MPCMDGGGPVADNSGTPMYADGLAQMLCGLCRRVEKIPRLSSLISADPVLSDWWRQHKINDSAREAEEAADKKRAELAKKARAKLSKAEREALGLR